MFIGDWVLVREDTNLRVDAGDPVWSFRGEQSVLIGGHPPRHAGSTGRVYVEGGGEYFPSVFGLIWLRGKVSPRIVECA